jgi:hypothetical protein
MCPHPQNPAQTDTDNAAEYSLTPAFGAFYTTLPSVYTPEDCAYLCSTIPECGVVTYAGSSDGGASVRMHRAVCAVLCHGCQALTAVHWCVLCVLNCRR